MDVEYATGVAPVVRTRDAVILVNGHEVWKTGTRVSKAEVISAHEVAPSAGAPGHVVLVLRGGTAYHITARAQ